MEPPPAPHLETELRGTIRSFFLLLTGLGALFHPPRRTAATTPVVARGRTLLRNAPYSNITFARSPSTFRAFFNNAASTSTTARCIWAASNAGIFSPFPRWTVAAIGFATAFACRGVAPAAAAAAPGCY